MVSITQERNALAKVGMTLRRREQWGARFNYTTSRPVDEPATRVFVHITITNPSAYSSNDAHARAVENIGINRFPSTGISYNRLVMPDGSLYEGQPMGRRGAHTVNDFRRSTCSTSGCPGRGSSLTAPSWNLNVNARAYVICQNTQHVVTDKMVDSLARAIAADKLAGMVTKNAAIHGHRCVSAKGCPGDRMWARIGEVNQKVNRYVANGLADSPPPPPPEDDMPLSAEDKTAIRSIVQEELTRNYSHPGPPATNVSTHHGGRYGFLAQSKADEILKVLQATPSLDVDKLAAAIVAKMPTAPGSIDLETVKKGVRAVLTEGVGDAPA